MQPVIDQSNCTRCGLCAAVCIRDVIDPGNFAIQPEGCSDCGHCVAVCPRGAIRVEGAASTAPALEAAPGSFENLVLMRRSVRRYKPEELSREHIGRLLELVRFAPTGTHTQAVAVTVLANRNRVREAVALALDYYRALGRLLNPVTAALLRPVLGKGLAGKLLAYKRRLARTAPGELDVLAHDAPALFIFHAPRSSTPAEDALIWAHTASLHAETLGIGTCYNGFLVKAMAGSRRFRAWLELPAGHRVYACFTAGYPAVRYRRPAARKPVEARILA
jgi:nitroreductase/NAD-dependent dihydropyrimidine dehydrogenase PreA subunit